LPGDEFSPEELERVEAELKAEARAYIDEMRYFK
jgi:hypothetical protein